MGQALLLVLIVTKTAHKGYVQGRNLHRKGGTEGDFFVTKQENVEGREVVWSIPPTSPPPRDQSH